MENEWRKGRTQRTLQFWFPLTAMLLPPFLNLCIKGEQQLLGGSWQQGCALGCRVMPGSLGHHPQSSCRVLIQPDSITSC